MNKNLQKLNNKNSKRVVKEEAKDSYKNQIVIWILKETKKSSQIKERHQEEVFKVIRKVIQW